MALDLIIVQHKPTQFDAPLYEYMERHKKPSFLVYYTSVDCGDWSVDTEIDCLPKWDNVGACSYRRRDLTAYEIANVSALADEIAHYKPGLVIICGYSPVLHAKVAWMLKKRGVRIGLRSDNTLRHSSFRGTKGLIKRLILPSLLALYDTWHPVGTLANKYLQETARMKRPVYLFPYNVDNLWFERESSKYVNQLSSVRSSMGILSHDFVILGVLKWNDREDPLTLLDAFTLLRRQLSTAKLILIGDGPLRDTIRTKAAVLGSAVILPGYISYSDLPKYYAISDVFVHPAPREPWGVSVNEAMACGVPVIAAEGVGAGVDLIIEGETGLTFPNHDVRRLCDSLQRLFADKQLLAYMSPAAKEKVAEWSYEQTHKEFLKALGVK